MNKIPTIAIVAHDVGGLGGMERHLEEMIMRLKRDMRVIVVAASMQLSDAEGVQFIRIPVIRRPAPLKMILFALLATIRLWFIRYDILHTTGAIVWNRAHMATVHFCSAGYRKAKSAANPGDRRSVWRRINDAAAGGIALCMEKWVYRPRRTRRLVAVSNRVKRELLDAYSYADEDIQVIPNGVDIQTFFPYSSSQKIATRKILGLPEQGRFLLFMGGDWFLKGLSHVVEAFDRAAKDFPDLYLLVVGKGEMKHYDKLISPENRDRVYFAGKKPNPQDWFGVSNVFVFPSRYETFSLVVHEAAAAGLTIISTKVGGVEELIEHGVNGFIVERDTLQIEQTIRQVIASGKSGKYGEAARLRAEKLTWENTYRLFLRLYRQIWNENDEGRSGSRGFAVERNHS